MLIAFLFILVNFLFNRNGGIKRRTGKSTPSSFPVATLRYAELNRINSHPLRGPILLLFGSRISVTRGRSNTRDITLYCCRTSNVNMIRQCHHFNRYFFVPISLPAVGYVPVMANDQLRFLHVYVRTSVCCLSKHRSQNRTMHIDLHDELVCD